MEVQAQFAEMWNGVYGKVVEWFEEFFRMLPNMAMAILVVVVAWFAARWLASFADRQIRRVSEQKQLRHLIVKLVRIGLIVGGLVVALGILNLDKTVTSVLAGVGILGLALGFAFKDIASNFMAGILLVFRKPFRTGDLVETADFFGRIEAINLRDTVGCTPQGLQVILPNSEVLSNPITNYDASSIRRVDLDCGIAYGDDLEKAEKVAIEAIEAVEERIGEKPVELFYEGFGDSSINFEVRFWVACDQKVYLAARSKAVKALKKAFDENDITIPFPIRTLDFGEVGGEPLGEHLRGVGFGKQG